MNKRHVVKMYNLNIYNIVGLLNAHSAIGNQKRNSLSFIARAISHHNHTFLPQCYKCNRSDIGYFVGALTIFEQVRFA